MNLNNILEFETRRPELTLIESKSTDGSFLIHHLISTILRDSPPSITFLITLAQTFSHYKSVQSKLGNSAQLTTALNNDQLIHIDLMTPLAQSAINLDYYPDSALDQAFKTIKAKSDSNHDQRVFVIIDDLAVAQLVGLHDNNLLGFLSRIRSIGDDGLVSVIVYIQSMSSSNRWFINDLAYMADLVLRTESLSTGYSKEIDGQIKIIKRESGFASKEKYLFKINERAVQLHPV